MKNYYTVIWKFVINFKNFRYITGRVLRIGKCFTSPKTDVIVFFLTGEGVLKLP